MENNFDLRKFLAEGSFANSPKQINEDFEGGQQGGAQGGEQGDQQQQRTQRYGDPCARLEDQLMNLYDKHGDELLNFIERFMRLTRGGQRGGAIRLMRSFKNFVGFAQIASKQVAYTNKGCGSALHFFADYMGADHIVDFMETMLMEDVQENEINEDVVDTLKNFFGLKEGEYNEAEDVAEGDYNEGEHNEKIKEEEVKEESINEGRGDLDTIIDAIDNHAQYGTDGYDIEEALEEILAELGDHYGYDISFTKKVNEEKDEE